MAPRARRAEASKPQPFHELGVRGRKTGVVLPDGGERDEHGMQPLDAIFSSPKPAAAPAHGGGLDDDDDDDAESDDMDIPSSPGPGPQTLLKKQRNGQPPHLPLSRSPAKTNLNSAARRNPHLARRDALDDDRNATVTRKLDFLGQQAGSSAVKTKPPTVSGSARAADDDSALSGYAADDVADSSEESIQMVSTMRINDDGDDDDGDSSDGRQEASPRPQDQSRVEGGGTKGEDEDEEPSVASVKRRRVGRPHREAQQTDGSEANRGSKTKRALRNSMGSSGAAHAIPRSRPGAEAEDEPRQSKRQRTKAPGTSKATPSPIETGEPGADEVEADGAPTAKAKAGKTPVAGRAGKKDKQPGPRPKGRPRRVAQEPDVEAETSFAALQRGPPLPRSRGLVSMRRDGNAVTQTRSGRHSYRPLDYWRGEQVIRDDETQNDIFHKSYFVLPGIKGVVRVPDEAPRAKTRAKANPGGKKRTQMRRQAAAAATDADEEPEAWELNPGTVTGEVVLWEPEHETQPPADDEPVQVTDERVAISADAIQTSDIKDASFRFAKTLTMPFMGSGVVDLPPGSEKRPKNSRKMHMVFFVHYGKVLVTINEAQFRISTGGTWFVPRGNYYSITNDYDYPSRIFFAQACEVQAPRTGDAPSALSTPTAPER